MELFGCRLPSSILYHCTVLYPFQIFQRVTARMMMTLLDTSSPPTWASRNTSRQSLTSLRPSTAIHGLLIQLSDVGQVQQQRGLRSSQEISGPATPWVTPLSRRVSCGSRFYPALLHRTSLLAKELLPAHPWNRLAAQVCVQNNEKRSSAFFIIVPLTTPKHTQTSLLHDVSLMTLNHCIECFATGLI